MLRVGLPVHSVALVRFLLLHLGKVVEHISKGMAHGVSTRGEGPCLVKLSFFFDCRRRILQGTRSIHLKVMLVLPQTALPVHIVVELWPESNLGELILPQLLHLLVNLLDDSVVSLQRLLGVSPVILAKSIGVEAVSHSFALFHLLLP